jgi:hypothetical protein
MRFIAAAGFALMLSCVLGACGGDAVPDVVATPEVRDASGASLAPQVRLSGERDADLHLWVSNQSFIDDPVVLAVSIDGVELIKQPFDVEGQHNWILLPVQAPPGRHTMRALSSTGAEIQTTSPCRSTDDGTPSSITGTIRTTVADTSPGDSRRLLSPSRRQHTCRLDRPQGDSDSAICRSRNRCSLPVAVLGKASTNSIARGYLYGAIRCFTKSCNSAIFASSP